MEWREVVEDWQEVCEYSAIVSYHISPLLSEDDAGEYMKDKAYL
jgi:hypothetical protein